MNILKKKTVKLVRKKVTVEITVACHSVNRITIKCTLTNIIIILFTHKLQLQSPFIFHIYFINIIIHYIFLQLFSFQTALHIFAEISLNKS